MCNSGRGEIKSCGSPDMVIPHHPASLTIAVTTLQRRDQVAEEASEWWAVGSERVAYSPLWTYALMASDERMGGCPALITVAPSWHSAIQSGFIWWCNREIVHPPLLPAHPALQADFDRVELEGKRRRFAEAEEELAALKAEFQGAEQVRGHCGKCWRGGAPGASEAEEELAIEGPILGGRLCRCRGGTPQE